MEREQIRMAILNQEQAFRQQVHELHRLYHVQKQLMKQMQIARLNQAQAIAAATAAAAETKPKFEITFAENSTNHHQFYSFQSSSIKIISSPEEEEEECDLELTLETGSSSGRGSARGQQKGKKEVKSSNSDSGTAVSSTSTESELAQFKDHQLDCAAAAETAPVVRFQSESKKRVVAAVVDNEMSLQPPWLNQCLSLRMA